MKWPLHGTALFALLFGQGPASANFWELYGFNPRAIALANCQVAATDDFTAVFYNPASMAGGAHPSFGFGFASSSPSLSIELERPSKLSPVSPEVSQAFTVGTTFGIGPGSGRRRIAMGVGLSLPTRSLLSGQAIDPAIPQWYLYQGLPHRLSVAAGLAARPVDWLSLGAGVQVLAGLSGKLDYELDLVAGRFSKKSLVFDIEPSFAPLLGLEVTPLPGLRVGLAYRAAISTEVSLPISLQITGIAGLDIATDLTVQYTPHTIVAGVSYTLTELGLLLTAELAASLWHWAPNPAVDSRIDAGGELLEGTGLAGVLDVPAPGQERIIDLGLRDVFSPRFGVEQRLGAFALRAGWGIHPSPAPVQASGSNYVDGTSHHLGLGGSFRFRDPWEALAAPIVVDVGGALIWLPSRRHEKIDSGDLVGPYRAGGHILSLSVALRYFFAGPDDGPTEAGGDPARR